MNNPSMHPARALAARAREPRADAPRDPGRRRALEALSGGALLALLAPRTPLAAAIQSEFGKDAPAPAAVDDPLFALKLHMLIVGTVLGVAGQAVPLIGGITAFLGLVGSIVGLFWPDSEPSADDIWNLIRDRVQHLVDSAISDAEFAILQNAITGLQQNLTDYATLQQIHLQLDSAQSLSDLRQKFIAVDAYCVGIRAQFLPQGKELRFLPLFTAFATLHQTLLQDMVLNGKHYGVEAGIAAGDVARLQQTIAINGVTFDHHWRDIEFLYRDHPLSHGDTNEVIHATRVKAPSGNKTYIEDGLYDRVKADHNTYAQLTVLAKDFRDLWPYMGGLRKGRAALTRELWLGPFGRPDALELPGDYAAIAPYDGNVPLSHNVWQHSSGYAASHVPQPSPPERLSQVGFQLLNFPRAENDVWRFPIEPVMQRTGTAMVHGQITRVRVDTGHYVSAGHAGGAATIPAAGFLVAKIYFWHEDGTMVSHGELATGPNGDGREMKAYYGEDLDVPAGHVLSGLHVNTRVNNLYRHVGANGAHTIGSMMFGFRLQDPTPPPSPELLLQFAVTHPVGLSLDQLMDLAVATRNAESFGAEERVRLRAELGRELDGAAFAERRAKFQARLGGRRHD